MSTSETDSATMKSEKEAMIQLIEKNEASRKMIESMSEGSEVEMEEKMRFCLEQFQKLLGWSEEQMENQKASEAVSPQPALGKFVMDGSWARIAPGSRSRASCVKVIGHFSSSAF